MFGVARHGTRSSVFAWRVLAAVEDCFTALPGVSCTALAAEVIDELNAVVGSAGVTGVRQALVNVALATLAHKTSRTHTTITTDTIHTPPTVKTPWLTS